MTRCLLFAIAAVSLSASVSPAGAQATPNVPNMDVAYGDLDALIAVGLVRNVIAGERPYSRAAFRRFVDEARSRSGAASTSLRVQEAIERLAKRFGNPESGVVRVSSVETRISAAASPSRPHRAGADGGLDADLNPLLLGSEGRVLADGGTASVEAGVSVASRVFAAQLTPRLSLLVPRTRSGPAGNATLTNAYGRMVVGPAALELGRDNVSVGHGLFGGPLLSHSARGLDMIRLAADRPLRLPSILGALGLWQAAFSVADLGNKRDIPGSKLAMLRLSHRPSTALEYGISYLNIQGGLGAPPADRWSRIHDLFFFWQDGGFLEISDKVAGADVRLLLPALGASVNVNFLTTDDRGHFTQPAGGYWEDAVWQVGADVSGLGTEGRTDIALEWTHAGPRAHTHGQFTSGVTLDRRILGSPLGPNAAGVTGQVRWNALASRVRVTGAWERYSGDDYYWALIPGGGPWDFDWFRAADNPDEIRVRIQSEYVRREGWRGLETSLRIGYEHVTRFNYGAAGRHNVVGEVALRYGW